MKDAYYFSHDSNARNDTKILAMRCDYGLKGYGMYWIIVEILRDESEYKLPLKEKTYKALAMQMHSTFEEVEKFINECIKDYELFVDDGEYFWAESLLRRMSKLEDIRDKRKKAAEKRWDKTPENSESYAKDMQMHSKSKASAKQTDAKESKVKESKEDIYSAFFENAWSKYPNKKGKGKVSATKKKELYKLGDEIFRCIDRYIEDTEKRRNNGFKDLQFQNGSTFFNSGYVDYMDSEYEQPKLKEVKPLTVKVVDL